MRVIGISGTLPFLPLFLYADFSGNPYLYAPEIKHIFSLWK